MGPTKPDKITVRWIDTKTGEDFTDRMNDPSVPPGEGVLEVARALGRFMAALEMEAERQLFSDVTAALQMETAEKALLRSPRAGDALVLNGVSYKYDGSTETGEHFTRLKGENWQEALISLRRGSAVADWLLRQLAPPQS